MIGDEGEDEHFSTSVTSSSSDYPRRGWLALSTFGSLQSFSIFVIVNDAASDSDLDKVIASQSLVDAQRSRLTFASIYSESTDLPGFITVLPSDDINLMAFSLVPLDVHYKNSSRTPVCFNDAIPYHR
jgi:hypothetical protein